MLRMLNVRQTCYLYHGRRNAQPGRLLAASRSQRIPPCIFLLVVFHRQEEATSSTILCVIPNAATVACFFVLTETFRAEHSAEVFIFFSVLFLFLLRCTVVAQNTACNIYRLYPE